VSRGRILASSADRQAAHRLGCANEPSFSRPGPPRKPVDELEKDVAAIGATEPASLDVAAKRQAVLKDVANVARAALGWGESVSIPSIRIGILSMATLKPLPEAPAIDAEVVATPALPAVEPSPPAA
jgi:hypothetical protein